MVISDVELTRNKSFTTLSAKCKIRKIGWDEVYFKVAAEHQSDVYADASPFASALLIPSMRRGEDLIIKGSISRQLYDGLQSIMAEVLGWEIGLKPIAIKADALVKDSYRPAKTATFFSGGVDSFYTYLKHTAKSATADRVDSLIFVNNGNDIDPRNKQLWDNTLESLREIAKAGQVDLVVVESNINSLELLNPIVPWDYIHGGCLAATGLFLRGGFRRIYVPSTHSVAEQIPYGSNLALDNHWSTEQTEFIHDGSETTRLNKVVSRIAKSPIALRHLRVCYMNKNGVYNCGKCDKCLRTMVNLYIAGVLDKSQTFPHQLDLLRIASTPTIAGQDLQIFHQENLAALRETHMDPGLEAAVGASIALTVGLKPATVSKKVRNKVAYLDHSYLKGWLYSGYSGLFGKRFSP